MSSKTSLLAAALAICVVVPAAHADKATAAYVAVNTVVIKLFHADIVKGNTRDTSHAAWVPGIQLRVHGPLPANTQIIADWGTAQGKSFLTETIGTLDKAIKDDDWTEFNFKPGEDTYPKGQQNTGAFTVKVSTHNELANGADTVLFSGKFEVSKALSNPDIKTPEYKNLYDFYVDYDWALPYAWLETVHWKNNDGTWELEAPMLEVYAWFRDDGQSQYKLDAFLFYKGEQVDEWKGAARGVANVDGWNTATKPYSWAQYKFIFQKTAQHKTKNTGGQSFFLDKNPGDYEIKLLRDGKLDRTIKFTIGDDGALPDTFGQLAKSAERYLVPSKLVAGPEGKVNLDAWKKNAFFGNPVPGFKIE